MSNLVRFTLVGVFAGDVNSLLLILGIVSLIVGALGIANVTLVTVMERVGEIGLRRARRPYRMIAVVTLTGALVGPNFAVTSRFTCGDVIYDVSSIDSIDNPNTGDQATELKFVTRMLAELDCP